MRRGAACGPDIKARPKGTTGFTPIATLYRVEHAFACLGAGTGLSRCYAGTETSARAWLEVAATAHLLTRPRVLPPERTLTGRSGARSRTARPGS